MRFISNKQLIELLVFSLLILLFSCQVKKEIEPAGFVLVIHGGAGNISRENMSQERAQEYKDDMGAALRKGYEILNNNGTSLDAVEAVIMIMEDSPNFNAGRGAVFTEKGLNELDASIMDGSTLEAGAVAGVTNIRNPISAARKVMTETNHVLLAGTGAEEFARTVGLETADSSWFRTGKRWEAYLKRKNKEAEKLNKHGTVGAVALDRHGNLAAGTSTGGMMMKKYGRVGDSPIIGAGTYANNESCAVSATGQGEFFIRNVVAYDIAARMLYLGESIEKATDYVINIKLKKQHANGGVIAVDHEGNISMTFNTTAMFRGYIKEGGEENIYIFSD